MLKHTLLNTNHNYHFNKHTTIKYTHMYEFLHRSFLSMSSLISTPVFVVTPDKININLFFLILKKTKSRFILENQHKLNIICTILTQFFRKPIELDLVRLYYPYYNSTILVNLFGIYINKMKLRKIVKHFIRKAINTSLPSKLTGINIKIAGRLLTQRVIPRKTIKIIHKGALSRAFIETARFTNKNKRGAFSITISMGHSVTPLLMVDDKVDRRSLWVGDFSVFESRLPFS